MKWQVLVYSFRMLWLESSVVQESPAIIEMWFPVVSFCEENGFSSHSPVGIQSKSCDYPAIFVQLARKMSSYSEYILLTFSHSAPSSKCVQMLVR